MGVTTRNQAKQEADKAVSASSPANLHYKNTKNTKTATKNTAKSAKGKGKASSRAAPPAPPKDDQAGIVFPTEGAGLANIAAILEGAGATYKVNWMTTLDGTKYINCIWFKLVTQDTMVQSLASVGFHHLSVL